MSKVKVDIKMNNNALLILTNAFTNFVDPNAAQGTKGAFNEAAHFIQNKWKNWAMGDTLPGAEDIKNPSNNLSQSIKVVDVSPYEKIIGTNNSYMERIVNGQNAYDMKETYPFGRKSRRTKDGRGYLIIPFRWGTPNKNGGARAHYRNVIPQNIYNIVKKYKVSVISKDTHFEENYKRQLIERQEYFWGDRLKEEDGDLGNAEGMVRMADKGGYFTFRIISEKNSMNGEKWWKKAVKPNDVPSALLLDSQKDVLDIIERGIMADLGTGEN